jgi:hypothetical protein
LDRDLRLHMLLRELDHRDVRLRLDGGRLHVQGGDKLTAALCDEIAKMRAELVEYLSTQGEEVVTDAEEASHADMHTQPAPELTREDKLRAGLAASKRKYMNGEVLVNDVNNFGHYMRQLVRERGRAEARERGEISPLF